MGYEGFVGKVTGFVLVRGAGFPRKQFIRFDGLEEVAVETAKGCVDDEVASCAASDTENCDSVAFYEGIGYLHWVVLFPRIYGFVECTGAYGQVIGVAFQEDNALPRHSWECQICSFVFRQGRRLCPRADRRLPRQSVHMSRTARGAGN